MFPPEGRTLSLNLYSNITENLTFIIKLNHLRVFDRKIGQTEPHYRRHNIPVGTTNNTRMRLNTAPTLGLVNPTRETELFKKI